PNRTVDPVSPAKAGILPPILPLWFRWPRRRSVIDRRSRSANGQGGPVQPGQGNAGLSGPLSFRRQDYLTYRRRLHRGVDVFAQILDRFEFDEDRAMSGIEMEIC